MFIYGAGNSIHILQQITTHCRERDVPEKSKLEAMEKPKPHAIVVPVPVPGHLNPMMKLAKLLHHRGFYISFVNTEMVQRLWLRSQGASVTDGTSTFRFLTIPDELNYENDGSDTDPSVWIKAIKNNLVAPFRELVSRLNKASGSDGFPPISYIVSDGHMTFTLDVAEDLGIPSALLFPFSASSAMTYAHLRQLIDKGFIPAKDANFLTNGYLDTVINWIPGMKDIQLKYMPSFIRTTDPDDAFLQFTIDETERAHKATIIVMNTFQTLEAKVMDELKSIFPQISTIGPLHLLENQLPQNEVSCLRPTLYKEDSGYLNWLDSKQPNSVILVAFGSTFSITAEQLMEFAWGLANSKQNFLWIIRPELVVGEAVVLPREFEIEIKDRGLIASWCNQESVLKHPAVGGFLTHCGWNSVLDSICAGVPLICWPIFAEQPTNCWFCCYHLGIALELDSEVNRDNVESLVRELVVGEKGREIKEKVRKWKITAEEASSKGGSSYENFEKMVGLLQSTPQLDNNNSR